MFPNYEKQIQNLKPESQFQVNFYEKVGLDFSSKDYPNLIPDIIHKEYRWIDTEESLK